MELSLPIEDETKYRTGLIGILISNIYETENASHANGGPRPEKGNLESVDYKGCEHSKLVLSEFHHITSAVLYKMKRASLLKRSTLLFCKSQRGLKLLNLRNDSLESLRMVYCEVSEHLTVNLDTSLVQKTH